MGVGRGSPSSPASALFANGLEPQPGCMFEASSASPVSSRRWLWRGRADGVQAHPDGGHGAKVGGDVEVDVEAGARPSTGRPARRPCPRRARRSATRNGRRPAARRRGTGSRCAAGGIGSRSSLRRMSTSAGRRRAAAGSVRWSPSAGPSGPWPRPWSPARGRPGSGDTPAPCCRGRPRGAPPRASSRSRRRWTSRAGDIRGTPRRRSLKRRRAGDHLAQQHHGPPRAQHLGRHGDRAELRHSCVVTSPISRRHITVLD